MEGSRQADRLLEALLDELDRISAELVAATREAIPSFAAVPEAEHLADAQAALEQLISRRLEGRAPTSGRLGDVGERRARQGVPVEDLLRAWRMGVEQLTAEARELARRLELDPEPVFDVIQDALGVADEAMVSIAHAHREAEDGAAGRAAARHEFVRAALTGSGSAAALRNQAAALGIDPADGLRAFRSPTGEEAGLGSMLAALATDGTRPRGLATLSDGELAGFCVGEPPRGVVEALAVGPAGSLEQLPASFGVAGRVAAAIRAFGLAGIQDLESAGLQVAVLEAGDVGAALVHRYVDPVRAKPNGAELLASIREWLAAGCRVEPAAARLHVHENTLRYRLRRYEELTGAELRETEQQLAVWWALHRALLTADGAGAIDRRGRGRAAAA